MKESCMKKTIRCDVCVIGGGLSGSFAALEAARLGAKVVLMQDRPMLGGNASSEIRMWVRGAKGTWDRETGLISELEERNIRYNPTLTHSLFDATLYGMLRENENVTLLLNTSCLDAETEGARITSVTGWQLTTYTYYTVSASVFLDCSGDSVLAPLVGAEYRVGREAASEYGEQLGQPVADSRTMGLSVLLAARETDRPVPFTPPPFANDYPTDDCFAADVRDNVHAQIRDHKIATSGTNLWWVELGGEGDSLHDADRVRDELTAAIYGVWDHMKNHGDHGMENWELEWVGCLPGKRESRRYVGDYTLTEADVLSGGHFDDEVAYGGWPLDDHNPYGMRKNGESDLPSVMIPVTEPYGIPLRCLYSRNVENLMFAGRNISVTHTALSSTRVMGTCSLLGQAAGCAAALAVRYGLTPRELAKRHTADVQKRLMDDGVFLPHLRRMPSALTQKAEVNLSPAERDILLNGMERPRTAYGENSIVLPIGSELRFRLAQPEYVGSLRLCFDPDFQRTSISDNAKMRVFAMKLHTGKDFAPVRVAASLVRDFAIFADGREIARIEGNFRRLVTVPVHAEIQELRVQWLATNGAPDVRLFSADLLTT